MLRYITFLLLLDSPCIQAIIINGYHYFYKDGSIYLFSDAHIDKFKDIPGIDQIDTQKDTPSTTEDSAELNEKSYNSPTEEQTQIFQKQFESLLDNKIPIGVFIEAEGTNTEGLLGMLHSYISQKKTITLQDEKEVRIKLKNIYTLWKWIDATEDLIAHIKYSIKHSRDPKIDPEKPFIAMEILMQNEVNDITFDSLKNELLNIQRGSTEIINSQFADAEKNFKNPIDIVPPEKESNGPRKNIINFMKEIANNYRNDRIIDFINTCIKEKKKSIFVFAGNEHIQAIIPELQNAMLIKKVEKLNINNQNEKDIVLKMLTGTLTTEDFNVMNKTDIEAVLTPPTFWQKVQLFISTHKNYLIPAATIAATAAIGATYWWLKSQQKAKGSV